MPIEENYIGIPAEMLWPASGGNHGAAPGQETGGAWRPVLVTQKDPVTGKTFARLMRAKTCSGREEAEMEIAVTRALDRVIAPGRDKDGERYRMERVPGGSGKFVVLDAGPVRQRPFEIKNESPIWRVRKSDLARVGRQIPYGEDTPGLDKKLVGTPRVAALEMAQMGTSTRSRAVAMHYALELLDRISGIGNAAGRGGAEGDVTLCKQMFDDGSGKPKQMPVIRLKNDAAAAYVAALSMGSPKGGSPTRKMLRSLEEISRHAERNVKLGSQNGNPAIKSAVNSLSMSERRTILRAVFGAFRSSLENDSPADRLDNSRLRKSADAGKEELAFGA